MKEINPKVQQAIDSIKGFDKEMDDEDPNVTIEMESERITVSIDYKL